MEPCVRIGAAGFTADVTFTLQVACFPFALFAVIVAIPAFFAVTTPPLTVATLGFALRQVIVLFVALDGETVAFKVYFCPAFTVTLVLFSVTDFTSITRSTDANCGTP